MGTEVAVIGEAALLISCSFVSETFQRYLCLDYNSAKAAHSMEGKRD
jgi:hypothetical protein